MKAACRLSQTSWETFQALDVTEKARFLGSTGREYHVLVAQQFNRERLERLGRWRRAYVGSPRTRRG